MRHIHPQGLWYMSAIYILVSLAFGTINSLLILFLLHNHLSQAEAYGLFAAFNSMIFTLPVVGGYMAEKLGYRYSGIVGLSFCSIGAWILGLFAQPLLIDMGLALFAFGLATAGTSAYCIVDMSYTKDDVRRESGFTLFYLLFNIGFFFSAIIGGYVSTHFSYQASFMLAAVMLTLALIAFWKWQNKFSAAEGRSLEPQVSWSKPRTYGTLIGISLAFSALGVALLHNVLVNNILLWALAFASGIGIMYMANKQPSKASKMKLSVFLLLCIVSIAFWSLYMLEPSLLTLFIEHSVNRRVLGTTIPPSTFYSLDPFFIVIFGLVLSWVWRTLAAKHKNLSLPSKFVLSLITMGVGYLVFRLSIGFSGNEHLINMGWVFFGYWFLSIAELLISPIGLSMVGRLSPEGSEGLLMGIWQLFIGLSAVISGYLADTAITPPSGSLAAMNQIYGHSFFYIGLSAVLIGILASFCIPFLKKLSGE